MAEQQVDDEFADSSDDNAVVCEEDVSPAVRQRQTKKKATRAKKTSASTSKPAGPRKSRAKKSEVKLQTRLEKYQTTDSQYPNCWLAYKKEKRELQAENKQERQRLKENQPIPDRIRGLLSQASRMQRWADTLDSQNRTPQADGARSKAKEHMAQAADLLHEQRDGDAEDLRAELDDMELNCLLKGIPPEYPYLCKKSDLREMEAKEKELQLAELQKQVTEYENLLAREKGDHEAVKALARELIQQIQHALPYVQDLKHKSRLEQLLDRLK